VTEELAIAPAVPHGLVVRTDAAGGAPVLRVRRRWPLLGMAAVVVAASAISSVPLVVSIAMMVVPVMMIRAGVVDFGRLRIDRDGVRVGGTTIALAEIERCEVEGRRAVAVLHGGRRVRLFTGTRAQASWLVRTVEAARAARGAPVPLPPARLLTR
jgi:hypothetical protein